MKIAALVLAAGGSSRLGQPKQLLPYQGESLVRRTVRIAQEAGCFPIVVTVGRDREAITAELGNLEVMLVPNEHWQRGLGSSIRAGIAALPAVDGVVILACDQPRVTGALLRQLIDKHQATGKPLVASSYANTVGVPTFFGRSCFADLLSLGDAEGAKALLTAQPDKVALVDFPAGAIDIDTREDFDALSS